MLIAVTVLAALLIAVGVVGIVVPVLPGLIVVLGAVVVWALVAQHTIGWVVLVVSLALAAAGWMLQYSIPTRRMQAYGVPGRTLLIGAGAGVVGFFVIPLLGLPIGFVLGVLGAEYVRLRSWDQAWPSAVQALKAALISYGIELTTALMIAIVFMVGASLLLFGSLQAVPSPVV